MTFPIFTNNYITVQLLRQNPLCTVNNGHWNTQEEFTKKMLNDEKVRFNIHLTFTFACVSVGWQLLNE